MSLENLEERYREALHDTLNQLQTLTLLIAHAETKLDDVRSSVQNLYQLVEQIMAYKKSE